jgi:type I restriction enzyme S subunit
MDNLNTEIIRSLEIRVPPLPVQRRIADILGVLDEKIELNRRMNETLETMAQALYRHWFVDFGPFQDREFTDTEELGPIPKGWEEQTLGDLTHRSRYGYTESSTEEPVGPKFLRIADINKQPWVEWSKVPHCPISEEDREKFSMKKGELFIARMADPGHGVMMEEEGKDAVFASYLIRFVPERDFHSRFLQYWMRSKPYWNLVNSRKKGSTRATLNATQLKNFPIAVPPDEIAKEFSDRVSDYRSLVVANVRENEKLIETRDYLLPKLISGEIEVDAAQEVAEDTIDSPA